MYGTQGFGTTSDDLYVPYEKKNCYALRRLFPKQILASRGFYIYLPVSKTNFTGNSKTWSLSRKNLFTCLPLFTLTMELHMHMHMHMHFTTGQRRMPHAFYFGSNVQHNLAS